jgi:hypothetical protein
MPAEQEHKQTVNKVGTHPAPVKQPADGFAVTSLVTGILTVVLCWLWPLALILGVLALVFGLISYNKNKSGMALAGTICGGVGLLLMIAFVIFVVAVARNVTTNYPSYY